MARENTLKLSILIPSVVDRPQLLKRLLERLEPQLNDQVEVVVFWNNYERQLGQLRQELLEDAKGEYICFIDDDDLVSEDYVSSILPKLDGVDYIGFMVDFYSNGALVGKPVIHSLSCSGWYDDATGFYRRVVHTNPVKKDLALLYANYADSDYKNSQPEDVMYARNMDRHVRTENFIPKPLHIYMQTDNHTWDKFVPKNGKYVRPTLPKYCRFHPLSTGDIL